MSSSASFSGRVQLVHQVVDKLEVIRVIDLFLLISCVENFGPHLLIVPLDPVKLPRQVKERSLVKAHFFFPECKDDALLKVTVKELPHMVSMQLAVVAESFEQS